MSLHSDGYTPAHAKPSFFRRVLNRRWKRVVTAIVCVLLALLIALAATFAVLYATGRSGLISSKAPGSAPSGYDIDLDDDGRTVRYNGKTYRYNSDIATLLLIGTDKKRAAAASGANGTNGQADALYLAAIDTKSGKVTVIAIPRDLMTEIDMYSASGNYIGRERKQVCLAYAYGDGKQLSCENTVTAVSGLLYGTDISTYFCMDKVYFAALTDVLGGVTVPEYDSNYKKTGRNITISGDRITEYISGRDKSVLESNSNRVERQVNFLKAFANKTIEQTKKDITVPLNLYNKLSKNSISTVDASKITYLATVFLNGGADLEFVTVPGKIVQGEKYAEMYADEKALYELLLDVFYVQQA